MVRKRKPDPEIVDVQINEETFSNAVAAFDAEGEAAQAARENALALAQDLGYEGSMTVTALEDEIRFYQRRSVEAVLELGKRLLLLKELTPHGEFTERVKTLGIHLGLARKFMVATLKFSKTTKSAVLEAVGNQSKLLELVVLDDTEIEALESGESVRGVTLDKIETMSVSELKAALRESKADLEASREAVARRDEKVRDLEEELNKKRLTIITPDEEQKALRQEAAGMAFDIEASILSGLRGAFSALSENPDSEDRQFMSGLLCNIERALRTVQGEFDLAAAPSADPTPAYLKGADTPIEIPAHIRGSQS
ncbi:MAG: hypothetical protein NC112_09125 [Oxalobacter formigenes]|nr:hypothetical protein [Oxalobacter formigenes]